MHALVALGLAAIGLYALVTGGALLILLAIRYWWVLALVGVVVAVAAQAPPQTPLSPTACHPQTERLWLPTLLKCD